MYEQVEAIVITAITVATICMLARTDESRELDQVKRALEMCRKEQAKAKSQLVSYKELLRLSRRNG